MPPASSTGHQRQPFLAYVEQFLVPTLRPATSSSWTIWAATKASRAPRIRAAGAKLFFLPPYCPDLNPIEQVFAKLKTLLRKAAQRTIEATWRRIGAFLACFTPQECANYFVNAGYASTEAIVL